MKLWWVFGYDKYYPGGGMGDLMHKTTSQELAEAWVKEASSGSGVNGGYPMYYWEIVFVLDEALKDD